jgi:hypothetical protein
MILGLCAGRKGRKILCRALEKKTHGKQDLCRACFVGRKANKIFAVRFSLSCTRQKTHGK